mgnify:CR=1 FL=1
MLRIYLSMAVSPSKDGFERPSSASEGFMYTVDCLSVAARLLTSLLMPLSIKLHATTCGTKPPVQMKHRYRTTSQESLPGPDTSFPLIYSEK